MLHLHGVSFREFLVNTEAAEWLFNYTSCFISMVMLHFHGVSQGQKLSTYCAFSYLIYGPLTRTTKWGMVATMRSLFMNFMSQWKQLNGFSSEHEASFYWLHCTSIGSLSLHEFHVTLEAAEWFLIKVDFFMNLHLYTICSKLLFLL